MDTKYLLKDFTYRELSEILRVKLQTLKRWGREFLPPDESAGQRKGMARLLTIDDAFILYLAQYLVSGHKFSIPDTRIILDDLMPWLKNKGLLPTLFIDGRLEKEPATWVIEISREKEGGFFRYKAQGELGSSEPEETKEEKYQSPYKIFKSKVVTKYVVEEIATEPSKPSPIAPDHGTRVVITITAMLVMDFFHFFGQLEESVATYLGVLSPRLKNDFESMFDISVAEFLKKES